MIRRLPSLHRKMLLPLLVFLGAGCAAGSYGSLQRSPEVTDSFRAARVLPGHRYYTAGSRNVPDAILAIAEPYTMKAQTWREERDLTPEELRILVFGIEEQGQGLTDFPTGMDVVGPGGEQIGVWYSDLYFTTVELLEWMGAEVYVHFEVETGETEEMTAVALRLEDLTRDLDLEASREGKRHLTARIEGRSAAREGEPVRFRIDPEGVFLFDPESGERVPAA